MSQKAFHMEEDIHLVVSLHLSNYQLENHVISTMTQRYGSTSLGFFFIQYLKVPIVVITSPDSVVSRMVVSVSGLYSLLVF